jgi:hypothetical protein
MNSALTNISVAIPETDMSFLEQMAKRLGWKVNRPSLSHDKISSIETSLKEAQNGETKCFDSVEDLMKDLLE